MKKVILALIVAAAFIAAAGYYLLYQRTSADHPPKSQSPVMLGKDIKIFMDTSMSMQGYFRTSNREGTAVQRFIWNGIIPILKEQYPNETIFFSSFGKMAIIIYLP